MFSRKRILHVLLALFLLAAGLGMVTREVHADDADVVIWFSDETVNKGDSVSATISVSGDSISSFTMDVSYTSSVLEFTGASGMANGGGGNVRVSLTGPGSVTLNFTAISNGSAYVSTSGSECYDINLNQLSVSHASASLTVSAPEPATEKKTDADKKDDPNNNTTEEKDDGRSKNCTLASLSVSPGNLSPSFSGGNTAYSMQVEKDVTSIVVSATPEDSKAETYVSGADSLKPGLNTVKVTVTAENGAVLVYTITVQCGDEKDPYQVVVDGITWKIDFASELEAPEGFVEGKTNYKGEEIDCITSPNKKVTLLTLSNEEESAWFIYDVKNTKFTPYVEYSAAFARFLILEAPDGVQVPDGYKPAEITISNNKVKAYSDGSNKGFYLIYAVNVDSKKEDAEGFYLYDSVENTYMRFPGVPEKAEEVPTEEATTEKAATQNEAPRVIDNHEPEEKEEEGFFSNSMLKLIAGILAGLLILLAIILIVMIVKVNKLRNRLGDHHDDDYDDDEDDDEPMDDEEKTPARKQRYNASYDDPVPEMKQDKAPEEATEALASENALSEDSKPDGMLSENMFAEDTEKEFRFEEERTVVKSGVTGDTGEILLETAEDNNSSVQIERVEEVQDRIKEAMKDRPFGIDSAFDVVAEDTEKLRVDEMTEEATEMIAEETGAVQESTAEKMQQAVDTVQENAAEETQQIVDTVQESAAVEAAEVQAAAETVQDKAAEEKKKIVLPEGFDE